MKMNKPHHIAIIMDGNGRWATARSKARVNGHRAGLDSLKKTIQLAIRDGISVLSLFAFSSENWRRPAYEVKALNQLFLQALSSQVQELHENNIRLRFIGDLSFFSQKLQTSMMAAQKLTVNNVGLQLIIAVNYGGQWDILQATRSLIQHYQASGESASTLTLDTFEQSLSTRDIPPPDLLIRTSGEQRISNFFLWQLAYTELYFTQVYWPDFDDACWLDALAHFKQCDRRYGEIASPDIS